MHGTVDPNEFLRGATPSLDKAALSRLEDDALDSKILRASLTTCIGLGEQIRRVEELRLQKAEQDETLKRLVKDNAAAVRDMAKLEETLQQTEQKVEAARVEARAEGKAEAEKAVVEAAKKAVEEAEVAKEEVVAKAWEDADAKAREDAVAAFVAEGWKVDDQKQWLASVVEATVDDWVTGPGAEWLARKGKEYYDGGEYFTQALCLPEARPALWGEPERV
ncbi:unnamed protein product [Cuscuta europaea]|uniref:Uncharacterized protein n=1 Tax=Cuscuta europaea TaxID=41803 RepID=A0A9P0ZCZ1_CUSEU|nr:unnamed protein product [Cuscuta europaea]